MDCYLVDRKVLIVGWCRLPTKPRQEDPADQVTFAKQVVTIEERRHLDIRKK